jgi:hypothetical protein
MTIKHERPQIGGSEAAAVETSTQSHFTAPAPPDQDPFRPATGRPPDAAAPKRPLTAFEALARLTEILPRLTSAVERLERADRRPPVEPMALRPEDLEAAIGVDNRTIQRWRSSGKFPAPDIRHGHTLLWRVETVRAWLERGGRP